MFLIGSFNALESPAWQAMVPLLVSKEEIGAAVAANADRVLQDAVVRYQVDGEPIVTHFVAAEPD